MFNEMYKDINSNSVNFNNVVEVTKTITKKVENVWNNLCDEIGGSDE